MKVDRKSFAIWVAGTALVSLVVTSASPSSKEPPTWAYGTDPALAGNRQPPAPRPVANGPQHLPGELAFSSQQIADRFGPADWFPSAHPKMPDIVAHGRQPEVWACGLCHYPNGKGRPENAGVAGLPVDYFVHQMAAFKSGIRHSADGRKNNTNIMIAIAKAMTDEEIQESANYFGSMAWTSWIKVGETRTVHKTRLSVGMYLPLEGNAVEPIGERIIEMPVDAEATETLRDPRSGFIAYAPIGSTRKGEELVTKGAGKTTACAICHGEDLRGLGPVPGIAGRSPSYLARQLYDMQQGTRSGGWNELMKPVVSRLSEEDILNIVAYTASRKP